MPRPGLPVPVHQLRVAARRALLCPPPRDPGSGEGGGGAVDEVAWGDGWPWFDEEEGIHLEDEEGEEDEIDRGHGDSNVDDGNTHTAWVTTTPHPFCDESNTPGRRRQQRHHQRCLSSHDMTAWPRSFANTPSPLISLSARHGNTCTTSTRTDSTFIGLDWIGLARGGGKTDGQTRRSFTGTPIPPFPLNTHAHIHTTTTHNTTQHQGRWVGNTEWIRWF